MNPNLSMTLPMTATTATTEICCCHHYPKGAERS